MIYYQNDKIIDCLMRSDKMKFYKIASAPIALVLSTIGFAPSSHAATVIEDFEAYAVQFDPTGPVFEVLNTTGGTVGIFSDGTANNTEIVVEASKVWVLETSIGGVTQNTGGVFDGHLGLASLRAGSTIGSYLAPGRDLSSATLSVDLKSWDSANSYFRFMLEDGNDNEGWSDPFPLTNSMQTFTVLGSNIHLGASPGVIDMTNIISLNFDLFDLPGTTVDGWEYDIDNVKITTTVVPVPAAVWLFGSGLLGLIGVARRKLKAA